MVHGFKNYDYASGPCGPVSDMQGRDYCVGMKRSVVPYLLRMCLVEKPCAKLLFSSSALASSFTTVFGLPQACGSDEAYVDKLRASVKGKAVKVGCKHEQKVREVHGVSYCVSSNMPEHKKYPQWPDNDLLDSRFSSLPCVNVGSPHLSRELLMPTELCELLPMRCYDLKSSPSMFSKQALASHRMKIAALLSSRGESEKIRDVSPPTPKDLDIEAGVQACCLQYGTGFRLDKKLRTQLSDP